MTREDKDLVTDKMPFELKEHQKIEEIMIRIVHLNDDTRESISSVDVKDGTYGINILKKSLTSDKKDLVDLVVKKFQ